MPPSEAAIAVLQEHKHTQEKENVAMWAAIDGVRADIKGLLWKLGALNGLSIVIGYLISHPR